MQATKSLYIRRRTRRQKYILELRKLNWTFPPIPVRMPQPLLLLIQYLFRQLVCLVTPVGFESESVDGANWTGGYIIKYGKDFHVEALCTDINGNTASAFDELTVDNSVPDFLIEINPKTIDTRDLEIKVTPSTALTSMPSVSISANEAVNVTYLSYSDGTYLYKAKINQINEGEHAVYVTGSELDSIGISGSSTFVVDHPG